MKTSICKLLFAFLSVLAFVPDAAVAADTWTTPHPGVRLLKRTTTAPIRAYGVTVDLCAAGVSTRVSKPTERQQRVSSFAQSVGAEVAVNGDFFSFDSYYTTGLSVGDGVHWSGTGDGTGSAVLAFGNDRAELAPASTRVAVEGWMNDVIGGHPEILRDGVVVSNSSTLCTARHPRTAGGLSADGTTLILAVVDGRSSASRGMTCNELGAFMKELGADDAVNFDGGGSSTMWVKGQGVVNNPSDGTERVVANHLAIVADGGNAMPEACLEGFHDAAELAHVWGDNLTTDVDGDGDADVCARAAAGVYCYANGTRISGPALSDASGWNDPTNYNTLRWGDLNADGLADLCARGNDRVNCWLSDGQGWPTRVDGPQLADSVGWSAVQFYSTIRLGDFTGDGMDDLCVRTASELRCYPSTGDGFGSVLSGPAMPAADGWSSPSRFGTLRMGDIDGDGDQDLCARRATGMVCWKSEGNGFGAEIEGPAWSDAKGFRWPKHWSTIRLADVDADGRADLCARMASGLVCHLSNGNGFGPEVTGPTWSDGSGWADPANFSTIRLGDIDGDRDLDVCARGNAGMVCATWDGARFGASVTGPELSDASGWGSPRHYRTIRLAHADGDGRADLCARAGAGWRCWHATDDGFGPGVAGPEWSNEAGWGALPYYSSIAMAGPRCIPMPEVCDGLDNDCDGAVDEGRVCVAEDVGVDAGPTPGPGDVGLDAGALDLGTPTADAGQGKPDGGSLAVVVEDGCSCASAPGDVAFLALLGWALGRRRRR